MYTGLLGGTFNPVHIGHIRLALEVLATTLPAPTPDEGTPLPRRIGRVDLIPCASPAHKPHTGLLPFDLRVALVEAAIDGMEGLHVNPLEGERQGPSYTWDTLCRYKEQEPEQKLLFILGDEAFAALETWHHGARIPTLADLLVVPRSGMTPATFARTAQTFWQQAQVRSQGEQCRIDLPQGGHVYWSPLPRLDINASHLRASWCAGDNIRYLVPDSTLRLLTTHQHRIRACWDAGKSHAPAHS